MTFLANFSEKIPGGAEPKIAIFELKFRGADFYATLQGMLELSKILTLVRKPPLMPECE